MTYDDITIYLQLRKYKLFDRNLLQIIREYTIDDFTNKVYTNYIKQEMIRIEDAYNKQKIYDEKVSHYKTIFTFYGVIDSIKNIILSNIYPQYIFNVHFTECDDYINIEMLTTIFKSEFENFIVNCRTYKYTDDYRHNKNTVNSGLEGNKQYIIEFHWCKNRTKTPYTDEFSNQVLLKIQENEELEYENKVKKFTTDMNKNIFNEIRQFILSNLDTITNEFNIYLRYKLVADVDDVKILLDIFRKEFKDFNVMYSNNILTSSIGPVFVFNKNNSHEKTILSFKLI